MKTKPAQHTPWSWTTDEKIYKGPNGDSKIQVGSYNGLVATAEGWRGDDETLKKTARLIAAAPDLLEAAKDLLKGVEAVPNIKWEELPLHNKLRAAIAKAEGGK